MIDYGINQTELPWGDPAIKEPQIRQVMQGIKNVGSHRIRMEVRLNLVAQSGWGIVDRAMNLAEEYSLQPLLCISWGAASGISAADYGARCRELAQRYGPSGTGQLDTYEIWNEVNWSAFFSPTNAAVYLTYLRAANDEIKSVHPNAFVITGGTAAIGTGGIDFPLIVPIPSFPFFTVASSMNPYDWYKALYAAGAQGHFDALGFHWYPSNDSFVWHEPTPTELTWTRLTEVRQLMVDNGDSAKQIWLTEIGFPFHPDGVNSLVTIRDWLQKQVNMITAENYFGPFYLYNYRNTAASTSIISNTQGIVNYDFTPKQPVYDYVATIADSDPGEPGGDTTPPTIPANVHVVTAQTTQDSLTWAWDASTDDTQMGGYLPYLNGMLTPGAPIDELAYTATGLAPGTFHDFYVRAVDAAGNQSDPSETVQGQTETLSGGQFQALYEYDFTGTGSTQPPVFTEYGWKKIDGVTSPSGLGFHVAFDVATHDDPSTGGYYLSGGIYTLDQGSPDHFSEITYGVGAGNQVRGDRSAMPQVRCDPLGSTFMCAWSFWDTCVIVRVVDGVPTECKSKSGAPAMGDGDKFRLIADGNTYTAIRISVFGQVTVLCEWTDATGLFPEPGNLRTGLGWKHIRAGSNNYGAPGLSGLWRGYDLRPTTGSGSPTGPAWVLVKAGVPWPAVSDAPAWARTID